MEQDKEAARLAAMERALDQAIKIEDELCRLLLEDAAQLKRATGIRTKLDALLAAQKALLGAPVTPQELQTLSVDLSGLVRHPGYQRFTS